MWKQLSALCLVAALAAPASAQYQVGDIVDNFTIVDTEGYSQSLYDYKGKIIVLNFGEWWCGPCNTEWNDMPDGLWDPNKDQGVMVFTIGSDVEENFIFKREQYGCEWPWLFDTGGQLYWDYGNGYIPYNVILDQDFRVVWGDAGYSGNFNTMQAQIDPNLYDVVVHQLGDPITVSPGDDVSLNVTLTNRLRTASSVQAFIDVILPGHGLFVGNPMMSQSVNIPGNMTGTASVQLRVPAVAPAGEYGVRVGLGPSQDDPHCSDLMKVNIQ